MRVAWWLAVAVSAAAYRRLLHPRRGRGEQLLEAFVALPFVVFATGIAFGAGWTTWH